MGKDIVALAAVVGCMLLAGLGFWKGAQIFDVSRARNALSSTLLDPRSAQFKDVSPHGSVLCGEVNSKNRMGGYAGFKRFIAATDATLILIESEDPDPLEAGSTLISPSRMDLERLRRCG